MFSDRFLCEHSCHRFDGKAEGGAVEEDWNHVVDSTEIPDNSADLSSDGQAHTGRGVRRQPTTTHLPFIGGGTSAKKMMNQMFDLLDNDGLHYVNADVLWITDFLIPNPPQQMLARFKEYKETGTGFMASGLFGMMTRSRMNGRIISTGFTL